jgi:glycosyltransferase involved in cell wall biosynthesis
VKSLASVIVPCWNQLEFTRDRIAALRRHVRQPWELVVIDNGSTDGTKDYLAGVQVMSPVPVTIVGNDANLGFPAAINQGLRQARGEYFVLLNNDVAVAEGWLDHLVALASASTERSTTEETVRSRERGGLDLTVIDFNELGAETAEACVSPPLTHHSQGGERARSLALSIDRAHQKHGSRNRPASTINRVVSLPQAWAVVIRAKCRFFRPRKSALNVGDSVLTSDLAAVPRQSGRLSHTSRQLAAAGFGVGGFV